MSVESILFSIVSANAGVGALIGSGDACRFYPMVVPQNAAMPAASYQIIVGVPEGVMNGAPVADGVRIQINTYANDDVATGSGYDKADEVSEAIERALEDLDAMIANGVGIRCVSRNSPDFDDELKRHRQSKDYRFWVSR